VVDVVAVDDAVVPELATADSECCPDECEVIICWIHCCWAGLNSGAGCDEAEVTSDEEEEAGSDVDDITRMDMICKAFFTNKELPLLVCYTRTVMCMH